MKTKNLKLGLLAIAVTATAALMACGGTLGGLPFGNIRVVNAISDSTSLDARASNLPSDINNVTVNTASGFRTVPDSSFNLAVTVNTASGSQPAFTFPNVDIDRDADTTVYLPGRISDGSFGSAAAFQIKNPNATISTGQVEITAVHAASQIQGTFALYLTAPTAATTGNAAPFNLSYRTGTAPVQIPGGSYRLRATYGGNPTVIFDSGTTGVTLAAGQRLQLAMLNETDSTRFSPIQFLAIPSDGSAPLAIRNAVTP